MSAYSQMGEGVIRDFSKDAASKKGNTKSIAKQNQKTHSDCLKCTH